MSAPDIWVCAYCYCVQPPPGPTRGGIAIALQARNPHLSVEQARYYVDAVLDAMLDEEAQ